MDRMKIMPDFRNRFCASSTRLSSSKVHDLKRLNREEREGREERHVFVGPEGQKEKIEPRRSRRTRRKD